jgi:predicted ATP-grasp superfamily ATP-dependent carboligase
MAMDDGERATGSLTGADTTTPAVVLKLDPNVMHHGGLGVIRSLGRIGVPVYGVHEGPLAPAARSRYLRGRYYWQPGSEDSGRIRDGLLRLADRIGAPAVLLPTDDAGAIFLAEHGAGLRSRFIFPDQPPHLPRQVAGKYSLHQLGRQLGIPAPAAVVPETPAAAREFGGRVGYPLIAKLTAPWQGGPAGRLRSTSIVTSPAQLDDLLAASARAGAGLMLQEFIPAGPGDDWFFHGYCDADATCRPAFTGVKERSYPAHAGLTSLGRSEPNPALRAQVTTMLSRLGYRGLLDLDLRRDNRDGEYKLLDFNPRLGAQFRLFATTAGVDVATAAYLDLTGQPIPDGEQTARRFVVENYDPLGALAYWRRGELSLRSWLSSLRAVDEAAWFARDDLRPFGLMCARMGWRLASRPVSRLGAARRRREPAPGPARFTGGRSVGPARAGQAGPGPQTLRQPLPRTTKEGARA